MASPILGGLIDRFGYRAFLLTIPCLFLAATHVLIGWTSLTPAVAFSLDGIGYSLYGSSIWPSVKYIVDKKHLGIAYGIRHHSVLSRKHV